MVSKRVFVKFKLNKRLSLNPKDIRNNEHQILIKDNDFFIKTYQRSMIYGAVNKLGGVTLYLNQVRIKNIINGLDNNTIPHELGHSLGLMHVNENHSRFRSLGFKSQQFWDQDKQRLDSNNVMFSGDSKYMHDLSSVDITREQIELIIYNYKSGSINQP